MSKARVETLSDGVFAIAITLLVLTIAQPGNYNHLAQELADRWPGFAAYVVSFAVIGIMWFNHHSIFTHFERVDRGLVYLNLLLLMTIVFIPYPTGIFGQALQKGQGAQTAAVLYSVVMALNAYAWSALWIYASRGRRLLSPGFPEAQRGKATVPSAARSTPSPLASRSSRPMRAWHFMRCLRCTTRSILSRAAPRATDQVAAMSMSTTTGAWSDGALPLRASRST